MISIAQLIPLALALGWLMTVPAKGAPAVASGVSTSGNIAWSVNPHNDDLMLVRAQGGGAPAKLCGVVSQANVDVEFSPDDKYIFVTDGGSSLGVHVTLYRRSSGVQYTRVTSYDFDLAVQRLAIKAETGKTIKGEVLDKSFLRCLGWSRDGRWALLQLSGRGTNNGKKVEISGFRCAFNPYENLFTTDLKGLK